MAILFFDGFDRCTITKQLDRNYWSFQPQLPVEYEKYAFGGYSYDHTEADYTNDYYSTYSPNNGHLPETKSLAPYSAFGVINSHPGFGAPLGFLALNNIDVSDTNLLAPLTYLQISGFSLPQSGESFLNFRIHGIETKDTDYHSSDLIGRFGSKHPLVAFCSGNTTGLILNIVKVTGNQLETIENTKMTIGLEVEQLAGASGSFDLNIGTDLQNYAIRSLYSDGSSYYHSGTAQASDLSDIGGRILMPVTDRNNATDQLPQTRWCHFTLGIIQTGVTPEIKVKLDDIDLLTIPTDDTITDKDLWDDKINISGFNYNNIRFFNRTYNASIPKMYTRQYYTSQGTFWTDHTTDSKSQYYEWGANTLLDDIILNDGSGTANTFLGKTAKVIPFTPGIKHVDYGTDVSDDGEVPDAYREWTTNTTSHRVALKNLDGDTGKISSAIAGSMTAVPYGSGNIQIPSAALDNWRYEIQDAIGGMKVYTSAKKEFLDSAFVPVVKTGEVDKDFASKTSILIRPSGGLVDALKKETVSFNPITPTPSLTSISKFGSGVNMHDSHLVVPFIESLSDLNQSDAFNNSHLYTNNSTLHNDNRFVIESWVYFTGSEPIDLYRTAPPTGYEHGVPTRSNTFNISCDQEGITYSASASGDTLNHVHTQNVKLLFNQTAATGEWHHVAFVQDYITAPSNNAWPIYSFLNGVRNSQYVLSIPSGMNYDLGLHNTYNFYYDIFPRSRSGIPHMFPSGDFNIEKNMLLNLSSPSGSLVGSGTFNNPATGVLTIQNTTNILNQDIISFTTDDTGFLVLNMTAVLDGDGYHQFEIYRNNVKQFTFNGRYSELSPTQTYPDSNPNPQVDHAQIYVNSGDHIGIRPFNSFSLSSPSTVNVKQLYVVSPTGTGPYYHHASFGTYNVKSQAFGIYQNRYVTDGGNFNNSKIFPTFIGGNNIMGQYRLTQGSATDENDLTTTRYRDDFDVPSTGFLIDKESYIDLSENINLTKTRYGKTQEFFVFNNPVANEPWTTGLIADPSGLFLGVRKT